MSSSTISARKAALHTIVARTARASTDGANGNGNGAPKSVSDYFGVNTFGAKQMRSKLPREVYQKLVSAIRNGKKLDIEMAPTVAQAIKEWAMSHGATHF